jgi:hypothetical protein
MSKRCHYCKKDLNNLATYYNIRKATKPKHIKNRWGLVGYCCESCEANGEALNYDEFVKDE